ncbi:MAG: hypothetical protein ACK5JP_12315 [Akkermansiaceae bacterium]|jgi:hypothetical protein
MKSFYILGLAISLISLAHAQDANPESNLDAEQIQKSIDEFNRNKKSKEAEVTVVLPPPNETETNSRAVPVEQPKTIVIPETPEPSNVRVESIRSGTGKIDPKNIEIKSSFPTKALTPPPAGWKLETSEQAPAFTRQVEIKPGVFITLEIIPHVLSPEADGAKVFSLTEPEYDHHKGYEQDHSVANILESSISQLETDSIKMGSALSELHQLLASLPKPEISAPNTLPPIKP